MIKSIKCFYLDTALTTLELNELKAWLSKHIVWLRGQAVELVQVRVPSILPTPDIDGTFSETQERRVALAQRNLKKAGITGEGGSRVVWITPDKTIWSAVFQMAIFLETGYYPFVVLRWSYDGDDQIRGEIRVVDANAMMGVES